MKKKDWVSTVHHTVFSSQTITADHSISLTYNVFLYLVFLSISGLIISVVFIVLI